MNKIIEEGQGVQNILDSARDLLLKLEERDVSYNGGVDGKDNTLETRAKYLEVLNQLRSIKAIGEKVRDKLRLGSGSILLDVGSGIGSDVEDIDLLMGETGTLICLDKDENLLNLSKEFHKSANIDIKYLNQDALNMGLKDNSVDAARAVRTLQHISKPKSVIEEMIRVTRPEGSIVVCDPDWTSFGIKGLAKKDTETVLEAFNRQSLVPYPQTGKHLASLVAKSGIKNVKEEIVEVEMQNFDRMDLLIGLNREVPKMVNDKILNGQDANDFFHRVHEAFEQGGASASINYHIVSGVAPSNC